MEGIGSFNLWLSRDGFLIGLYIYYWWRIRSSNLPMPLIIGSSNLPIPIFQSLPTSNGTSLLICNTTMFYTSAKLSCVTKDEQPIRIMGIIIWAHLIHHLKMLIVYHHQMKQHIFFVKQIIVNVPSIIYIYSCKIW